MRGDDMGSPGIEWLSFENKRARHSVAFFQFSFWSVAMKRLASKEDAFDCSDFSRLRAHPDCAEALPSPLALFLLLLARGSFCAGLAQQHQGRICASCGAESCDVPNLRAFLIQTLSILRARAEPWPGVCGATLIPVGSYIFFPASRRLAFPLLV
jgi:hypothetical protein